MSLLDDYLNQEVTWTPAQRNADGTVKKDGTGRPLYDPSHTIRANLNEQFRMVRDKTGAEVVSSGDAKVMEAVQIGDKVNSREVIAIALKRGLGGEDEGRTVYLK